MATNSPEVAGDDTALVRATMAEARFDGSVDAKHVLERLKDWRDRTHKLYEFIQKTLGTEFTYDRTGKHQSFEEPVQRAGLSKDEVPALDILRIERPQGTLRALVMPGGLWVIGVNARLDLRVLGSTNRQKYYFLVDKSQPLSGAENAAWYIVDRSNRLEHRALTEDVLRFVIEASN